MSTKANNHGGRMRLNEIYGYLKKVEYYASAVDDHDQAIIVEIKKAVQAIEKALSKPNKAVLPSKIKPFLEARIKVVHQLTDHREVVQALVGEGGVLSELGDVIVDGNLEAMRSNGNLLKEKIHNIENLPFRRLINHRFHTLKEQNIRQAITQQAVSWKCTLDRSAGLWRGISERVIEFPLAFEIAAFDQPGKILDAGAAMNLPYIRELIGNPRAKVIHFTQAGTKEMCQFQGDRYSYLFGDLRATDFMDGTFDRILFISTLEHIGMDNRRYGGSDEQGSRVVSESEDDSHLEAVREMLRLLAPGGKLAITVPYGVKKSLNWYQVFDRTMVEAVLDVCRDQHVVAKYYYYESGWYEGDSLLPQSLAKSGSDVTGMCALLITKARRKNKARRKSN